MTIELTPVEAPPVEAPPVEAPPVEVEAPEVEAPATPPAEAAPIEPCVETRRGRGRPAGSKNKPKETPIEVVVETPPEPKKKKPRAVKPVPENPPEPEVEAPSAPVRLKKERAPEPIAPERVNPDDLLRQMHADARTRIADSYASRRDQWVNKLSAQYK